MLGLAFLSLAALLALAVGAYMTWQWNRLHERAEQMERLVVVSWGDSQTHKAFYGAYVYYEPAPDGKLNVFLAVRIDRSSADTGYQFEPRLVGTVSSPEEAVAKWGIATWSPAGLTLGSGPGAYLFVRDDLERHR